MNVTRNALNNDIVTKTALAFRRFPINTKVMKQTYKINLDPPKNTDKLIAL